MTKCAREALLAAKDLHLWLPDVDCLELLEGLHLLFETSAQGIGSKWSSGREGPTAKPKREVQAPRRAIQLPI